MLFRRSIPYLIVFLFPFSGCWDKALFTELATSRLKVILKGTYESNGPTIPWSSPDVNLYAGAQDDSVITINGSPGNEDTYPTRFMFDIASMRLDGTIFSNYRQTFTIPLTTDSHSFFDGTGIKLLCDDAEPGRNYKKLKIYFRKMLFNKGKKYKAGSGGWEYVEDLQDIFEENTVDAFNFNLYQVNSYYDSLRMEPVNEVFPLKIPIVGGLKYGSNDSAVLEVRIVVKNYIKKYERKSYSGDDLFVYHFYAFSDWLRDVQEGDTTMGGNVLAVARMYDPAQVGRIKVNASGAGYVIAVPVDQFSDITDYTIPKGPPDFSDRNAFNPCNLPKAPNPNVLTFEQLLDYFLDYERFKHDWNQKIGTCSDFTTYQTEWNNYENEADGFKIPPLAIYVSSGGTYYLENVMPGTYKVYHANVPAYGKLFNDTDFIEVTYPQPGIPVTVDPKADSDPVSY